MTRLWAGWMAALMALCGLVPGLAQAVTIDGVLDPDEWAGAHHFEHFVSVQPLTGAPAPDDRRAEAYLKSTPEGIAVAIRAWHPADVSQARSRMQRDGRDAVDRMNFMIDFDADGRVAYDFAITTAGDVTDEVISNENVSNLDWDGAWKHAVADFQGGYVSEFLIPWSTAQMRNSSAPTRTIGVYFDRVMVATGQRFGYPEASFTRPRFVSDFTRIEIDQFPQSQLAVTPYLQGMRDQIEGGIHAKAGADIFWKPSGDHQFAVSLSPDFGQVESDDLVVDFSNVEVFFTDKRPFFTDNQSYFELQNNLGTLFYTRRVGANDDIRAAVKGNGSFGHFGYGVFAAQEEGVGGRDFSLVRTTYDAGPLDLGLSRSRTRQQASGRVADVTAVDARWQPDAHWLVRPLLMQSESHTQGRPQRGKAAGVTIDWDMPGPWRQQYFANYSSRDFELNDLGFQSRNDFRYFEWESGYRQDNLPAGSPYASHDWEIELVSNQTIAGRTLRRSLTVQRYSELRDGGNLSAFVRWRMPAWDDRITRGNGIVPLQSGPQLYVARSRPRQGEGRFAWEWSVNAFPNAVSGFTVIAGVQPRWHANDHFDVDIGLFVTHQSDWLLWQEGRELGSFKTRRAEVSSKLNWFIDDRQELRVKLQTIAIAAKAGQARRLVDDRLLDSAAGIADFNLRNLGFQIRYRYKLGMLSDIFAVYSRGGLAVDEALPGTPAPGLDETFTDVFSLRDTDQILLKIAYRFEL